MTGRVHKETRGVLWNVVEGFGLAKVELEQLDVGSRHQRFGLLSSGVADTGIHGGCGILGGQTLDNKSKAQVRRQSNLHNSSSNAAR